MKTGLSFWQRVVLAVGCFALAILGFLVKLPSGFRHLDKELHATFYFLAAAFLNVLFAGTNVLRHALIFVALYLFGMGIEYAQAFSNRYFRVRIHGRFDPEDVQANLHGLLAFSLLWALCVVAITVYKRVAWKQKDA